MKSGISTTWRQGELAVLWCLTSVVLVLSGCSVSDSAPSADKTGSQINKLVESQDDGRSCDPNYRGACVPLVSYDLDCKDIEGPVYVIGIDIHRLDRDRDGIGCEPWP